MIILKMLKAKCGSASEVYEIKKNHMQDNIINQKLVQIRKNKTSNIKFV